MSESSRRSFLKLSGAGAAAVGVAAVTPAILASSDKADTSVPAGVSGSMMAYIHDVRSAEVSLMVEGREVVVKDQALVARLTRAMHGGAAATTHDIP